MFGGFHFFSAIGIFLRAVGLANWFLFLIFFLDMELMSSFKN